ncbi:hypothetical protein LXL04_030449 [Taraxacum kok-saghyz]
MKFTSTSKQNKVADQVYVDLNDDPDHDQPPRSPPMSWKPPKEKHERGMGGKPLPTKIFIEKVGRQNDVTTLHKARVDLGMDVAQGRVDHISPVDHSTRPVWILSWPAHAPCAEYTNISESTVTIISNANNHFTMHIADIAVNNVSCWNSESKLKWDFASLQLQELKTGAVKLCNSYLVIEEDTSVQLLDQCRTEEGFNCPTSRGSASRSSLNQRLQVPEIEKRKKLLLEKQEVIDRVEDRNQPKRRRRRVRRELRAVFIELWWQWLWLRWWWIGESKKKTPIGAEAGGGGSLVRPENRREGRRHRKEQQWLHRWWWIAIVRRSDGDALEIDLVRKEQSWRRLRQLEWRRWRWELIGDKADLTGSRRRRDREKLQRRRKATGRRRMGKRNRSSEGFNWIRVKGSGSGGSKPGTGNGTLYVGDRGVARDGFLALLCFVIYQSLKSQRAIELRGKN